MKNMFRHLMVGSMLVLGASACADLDVVNQNDPDAERTLSTPGDVLSLIGGSFNNWFYGNYSYFSAGMALSNAAFQHNAPWANAGMEKYGRLPRVAFINSISDGDYNYMTRSWFYSYRAIAAVADGLRSLAKPEISDALSATEVSSAKAFGKFIQGISHAQIALLFSEGFVVDENTDLLEPQDPLPYDQLMDVAMGYLDESISLAAGQSWALEDGWLPVPDGDEITGDELARIAHSMKARYMSGNARSWEERQALPWNQIIAEVDAGIDEDFIAYYNDATNWNMDARGYGVYYGWSQMAYFIYGMADQSGDFQAWNALSLGEKTHTIGGDPVLIVTPDLRFPQGSTVAEQRANTGMYFRVNTPSETGGTWARPDRGTWRWSWYKHTRWNDYWEGLPGDAPVELPLNWAQPEILMTEMNLIKAEGLYHTGDLAGAAAIINETRTAAGLNATDASGTNTSCVPKLVNGTCGDLFEMLKWEKRMENTFVGPFAAGWYFDSRGWGDLWESTFLQLPIPCAEAQVLQLLPCETFGGPGGAGGAPNSTYDWNGEG